MKFKQKSAIVEAIQYDGTEEKLGEIIEMGKVGEMTLIVGKNLVMETPDSSYKVCEGDFVVKEPNGRISSFPKSVFAESFEEV